MKELSLGIVYAGLVAVLFIPLVVTDSMFFPFITGKNFYFRIIVEIITAAWIILALYDVRYRPRFSWFLPSIGSLLVVMFFANLLGAHPMSSFWSNFERMDGYVTLVHFAAYFLVLGSMLSHNKIDFFGYKVTPWYIFISVAFLASLGVVMNSLQQYAGVETITMGSRINGTLGNAAYMAVYMLFTIFFVMWLARHTKIAALRYFYFLYAAVCAFLLVQSATRGTMIGLSFGVAMSSLYIILMGKQQQFFRKIAIGALLAVIMLVGTLIVAKDTAFVQDSNILKRATSVNSTELSLRMDIWRIALKGAKERPILGWGQSNYNYVFNEYYEPSFAHRAELWYDRAHNIFMDWLVTGGVLGLTLYLSIFVAALYYIVWIPLWGKNNGLDVIDNALLFGIGSAYFTHNLVVFDNIVSYIFFAIVLAMVHSSVSKPMISLDKVKVHESVVSQVAAPLIIVAMLAVVYVVNIPQMQSAQDLIKAFQVQTVPEKYEAFEKAFSRNPFAVQEITEQMAQQALSMVQNPNLPQEEVKKFVSEAESRLKELQSSKPGDARVEVFMVSFYRGVGNIEAAREHARKARELSPGKPHIILEQALVEYQSGDIAAMNAFMKQSYEMDNMNRDAQIFYAASALMSGVPEAEAVSVVSEINWPQVVTNDFFLRAADGAGATSTVIRVLQDRIAIATSTPQNYFSLSSVYYRNGNIPSAIEWLEKSKSVSPKTAKNADCYIGNMKADRDPNFGC